MGLAALVAAMTLWLLTNAGLIAPWIGIAMAGAIALPAAMLGLGLAIGGLVGVTAAQRDWRFHVSRLAAAIPFALGGLMSLAG